MPKILIWYLFIQYFACGKLAKNEQKKYEKVVDISTFSAYNRDSF